jgi:hypothetical protein
MPKANFTEILLFISFTLCSYESECWTLKKEKNEKNGDSVMRFVRATAGYRMTDRKRDKDIRGGQAVTDMGALMKEHQMKWLEHLELIFGRGISNVLYQY